MHAAAVTMAIALILILLCQVVTVLAYTYWLRNTKFVDPEAHELPFVAVILSLRGADLGLRHCLNGLLKLSYPKYEVHIIIDHESDPSKQIVEDWLTEHPDSPVFTHLLKDISQFAYLKTSAIRQCIRELPGHVDAVAIIDADTVPYPQWLCHMVSPFSNADIGLVSGNRWYDYRDSSWGSIIRYIYNGWSVPIMLLIKATWGGSLALRKEIYNQQFFFDAMEETSCEDSAIQASMHHAGKSLKIHPDVIMLQYDSIDIFNCYKFIRRQLIWTRLYHPHWTIIFFGVIVLYFLTAAASIVGIIAIVSGDFLIAFTLFAAITSLLVGNWILLLWTDYEVRARIAVDRPHPKSSATWHDRFRVLIAIPLAFLVFVLAVAAAAVARRVWWSGIGYKILRANKIELIGYQPIVLTQKDQDLPHTS